FEEKPQILFQTWETFFAIQCSQHEDSNELFQKLLKDLKELAEYDQFTNHPVQNKESHENSSEENVVSKTNQEPPQSSDIHQLIEECSVEVPEEQKQNMEKTMLDLVKICHHKQFLCMHDNVDDLIKSALDSKLLSINFINFQLLNKKEQEVKIVEEQPAEGRNQSDEVTKSNAKNLLPIPSECEERLINLVENDNSDSSNDPLLEEADLFLDDNLIPPGIENFADDPKGDIHFLEELLINDSILSHESFDSSFKDSPLIPRPPPEPPDVETDVGEEIAVMMNDKDKFDDDYQIFMFDKVFSLLSAESEDTIFDP
nr:hypothetical protein [Tanacetum cinerariifolium]